MNSTSSSASYSLLRLSTAVGLIALGLSLLLPIANAVAQSCKRDGSLVTCDDGRVGTFAGDAIIWSDGTRSSTAPHPSVIIGHKPSVQIGPGVFVGKGSGVVPLDNPNAPNKTRCAVLDGVSYCH